MAGNLDHALVDEFFGGQPDWVKEIRKRLAMANISVTFVYKNAVPEGHSAFLIKPSGGGVFAQALGSDQEILVVTTRFKVVEPRTMSFAESILKADRLRPNHDFCLIFGPDPRGEATADDLTDRLPIQFVYVNSDSFNDRADTPDKIRQTILRRLFRRDPFLFRGAVHDPQQFFGRRRDLTELRQALDAGSRHIGLFGLRKVGKTSLLLRLKQELDSTSTALIVHVQLQTLQAVSDDPAYVLWSLGLLIADHAQRHSASLAETVRHISKYELFSEVENKNFEAIADGFSHDLRSLLDSVRIVLILDEIERIWPGDKPADDSVWSLGFVRLWRLIRGLDQERPGRLALLVTGTSPQCLQSTKIGREDNPFFDYLELRYLGPLERSEGESLLRALGSRAGINWDPEALNLIFDFCGGHPALLRAVGSFAFGLKTDSIPCLITKRMLVDREGQLLDYLAMNLSEIVASLKTYLPDELDVLNALSLGNVLEFDELVAGFPETLVRLRGLRLVEGESKLAFQAIRRHLLRTLKPTTPAGVIPQQVGNYRVVRVLGKGGFATTLLVSGQQGGVEHHYALKLYEHGTINDVDREFDMLSRINHPNVLRVIDRGITPEDGRPFILTQYIEGNPLSRYLDSALHPTPKQFRALLRAVLVALRDIHPNPARANELRSKTELSQDEADELQRARSGIIHRDIKPDNIIETKHGVPILIDFGISTAANSQVKTMRHTPGYLPPDVQFGAWEPSVDIFQVGITFAQIFLGLRMVTQDRPHENLRQQLRARHRTEPNLVDFLARLFAATGERFGTAAEAITALDAISS